MGGSSFVENWFPIDLSGEVSRMRTGLHHLPPSRSWAAIRPRTSIRASVSTKPVVCCRSPSRFQSALWLRANHRRSLGRVVPLEALS